MIEVSGLVKRYRTRGRGEVRALDGVDFTVGRGEVLGLVGESGCGKSTTARLLVRLEEATSGSIRIGGRDVTAARGADLAALRRKVQLVFQDPYASLNPRMRAGDALDEVLRVHRPDASAADRRARVAELFGLVGLVAATAGRFPHQLSGGQRQRVGIARALAAGPEVLVLDEPVSALDVSVRAEIINLLERLRAELSLTYVFISHDLGMVRHLADRIAVMYLGRIVEYGPWDEVSDTPLHPYARALQGAVPVADPALDARPEAATVVGEIPDAANVPAGCRFHPRCPLAEDACRTTEPALLPMPAPAQPVATPPVAAGSAGAEHVIACHVVARELAEAAGTTKEES